MGVTAILFPGQGSQTPEMRKTVAEVRPDLLSLADEIVGEDPFARAEEGTRFAQPAIFCASLAGWQALERPSGDLMAGHSLGELAALVAAGCLSERDGLELVALRGKLMQESGERAGDGGMVAAPRRHRVLRGHGRAVRGRARPARPSFDHARALARCAACDARTGRPSVRRGRAGTRPDRTRQAHAEGRGARTCLSRT
ncbi:MAG: ACP S-malonyltransferase [Solirubrobacterales bacterium]|nr:ACP S-malonyltransferase [Solirubrobacterales bacterium]